MSSPDASPPMKCADEERAPAGTYFEFVPGPLPLIPGMLRRERFERASVLPEIEARLGYSILSYPVGDPRTVLATLL